MTRGDLERRVAALEAAVERRIDGSNADDEGSRGISRRAVLKGLGVIGLAGYGAGSASADPQGQLGTESDPVRTVFTQRLAGGLTDEDPIASLVGTGLSVDDETLHTSVADAANTGEGERLYAGRDGSTLQFRSLVEGRNVSLSTDDGEVTIEADSSSSGESNTASNLGNGTGVFAGKSGTDLQFKSLVEGTNVSLSAGTDEVTIDASGAGEANTASNVGTGAGVFAQKAGTDLEFRSLVAGSNLRVSSGTSEITLDADPTYPSVSDSGTGVLSDPSDLDFGTNLAVTDDGDGTVTVDASTSGEANTASNLGTGTGLFAQKNGVDLEFNSLVGGTNVNLSASGGDVTIDVPSTSSAWEDGDGDTLLEPVSGSGYTGIDLSGISGAQVVTPWVGTTSATAFEAFVNGTRVARFEVEGTDSTGNTSAGNVLIGQHAQVVNDPVGAAVSGGGGNGVENSVEANFATVGGGENNIASGRFSTVPGGSGNRASGNYSFAAGRQSRANYDGTFVWADSDSSTIQATGADQFIVSAAGGVWIGDGTSPSFPNGGLIETSSGAYLSSGGTWTDSSSRTVKGDVRSVDGPEILEKVEGLPVSTWSYDEEPDDVRHCGPMAEDFAETFGLGADDEHIASLDTAGVALGAIQGLSERLDERDARVDELESELDERADRIEDLEAELESRDERIDALEERLEDVERAIDGCE